MPRSGPSRPGPPVRRHGQPHQLLRQLRNPGHRGTAAARRIVLARPLRRELHLQQQIRTRRGHRRPGLRAALPPAPRPPGRLPVRRPAVAAPGPCHPGQRYTAPGTPHVTHIRTLRPLWGDGTRTWRAPSSPGRRRRPAPAARSVRAEVVRLLARWSASTPGGPRPLADGVGDVPWRVGGWGCGRGRQIVGAGLGCDGAGGRRRKWCAGARAPVSHRGGRQGAAAAYGLGGVGVHAAGGAGAGDLDGGGFAGDDGARSVPQSSTATCPGVCPGVANSRTPGATSTPVPGAVAAGTSITSSRRASRIGWTQSRSTCRCGASTGACAQ